jgi:hypothetical protein
MKMVYAYSLAAAVQPNTVTVVGAVLEEVSTFNEQHGAGRALSEVFLRKLF